MKNGLALNSHIISAVKWKKLLDVFFVQVAQLHVTEVAQLFDEQQQWFQIQFGRSVFHEKVNAVTQQTDDLSHQFLIQITAAAETKYNQLDDVIAANREHE